MTDAEMIKKQAEKIFSLEDMVADYMSKYVDLEEQHRDLAIAKADAELRALSHAQKLKAIEEEIGQYQFDSVTNLVNKIKSILMSENND